VYYSPVTLLQATLSGERHPLHTGAVEADRNVAFRMALGFLPAKFHPGQAVERASDHSQSGFRPREPAVVQELPADPTQIVTRRGEQLVLVPRREWDVMLPPVKALYRSRHRQAMELSFEMVKGSVLPPEEGCIVEGKWSPPWDSSFPMKKAFVRFFLCRLEVEMPHGATVEGKTRAANKGELRAAASKQVHSVIYSCLHHRWMK
jgi:hypothetical protein